MMQSFYNGVTGALTHQFGIDSWSNNIANINTNGYKANTPEFGSLFAKDLQYINGSSTVNSTPNYGVTVSANAINMTNGSLVDAQDSNPFNMAISEKGWFVVGKSNSTYPNSTQYTRDGEFKRDGNGNIVTSSGEYLYGIDLGKISNGEFKTDLAKNENLKAENPTLVPLQIPENIYYSPAITSYVNSSVNLNSTDNLTSIDGAFLSDDGVFDESAFKANNVNTIYNELGKSVNIKDGDTITISVDGKAKTLTYGKNFTTMGELMSEFQKATKLDVVIDDCRIKATNNTKNVMDLKFSSSNDNLISNLGLRDMTLKPTESISSTALSVPTFKNDIEVFNASGEKFILHSDYVLTNLDFGGVENWSMRSAIFDRDLNKKYTEGYVKGSMEFDNSGNTPPQLFDSSGAKIENLDIPFANGSIKFDPTKVDENSFTANAKFYGSEQKKVDKDGAEQGYLEDIAIDSNGIINLVFSNQKYEAMGRVGVAGFVNDQGLAKVGSNLFSLNPQSVNGVNGATSGLPFLMWDNAGNLKSTEVLQGFVETSNVEMARALTELMVMQRAYSANTKTITTADEMVKEAIGLKR